MSDEIKQQTNTVIVVTTIFPPTPSMISIAEGALNAGLRVIVAGDEKSPSRFDLSDTVFLTLTDQCDFSKLARRAPTGSYARKNLAYMWAMRCGVDIILETDDDNMPNNSFFMPGPRNLNAPQANGKTWLNVYDYFTDTGHVWPRGFPLEFIQQGRGNIPYDQLISAEVDAPIQQSLSDGDPDVDAVYRMTSNLPVLFIKGRSIALNEGTWCPFNSQNTTWYRDAFQLMYLPSYCTFRMTDIWRSFVAQRIAWTNGWSVVFHSPNVWQDRNEHDLFTDFHNEVPGYLHNAEIAKLLQAVELPSGIENIGMAMRICYQKLIDFQFVGSNEMELLDLWISESESYLS